MRTYKVDLHTHSTGSPDGGLTKRHYQFFLDNDLLDVVAITDHNRIDIAQQYQAELGGRIIVGEEISTSEGELIGLHLSKLVEPGQTALATAQAIKNQGGLVYVPHPFETVRSGISEQTLEQIAQHVDIIEGYNGRAVFQNRGALARKWAAKLQVPIAASSDAHGRTGWGYTYSLLDAAPTHASLVSLLKSAGYSTRTVGVGIIYPKLNRLMRKFRHAA